MVLSVYKNSTLFLIIFKYLNTNFMKNYRVLIGNKNSNYHSKQHIDSTI